MHPPPSLPPSLPPFLPLTLSLPIQYMTEKMGKDEGSTKLDEDYKELERVSAQTLLWSPCQVSSRKCFTPLIEGVVNG